MTAKISKTNDSLTFLNARLDEVGLSAYDRVRAKAQLARAEAFADFSASIWHGIARLFKGAQGKDRAPRHTAPSAG